MTKCKDPNCTGVYKYAIYGFTTDNKAIRCKACKTNNMINVKSKMCEDCSTRPSYGYEHDNVPIKCYKHRTNDMVNVVNKICEYQNCKRQASCGYPNSIATHCEICMIDGMILLHNKESKKCDIEGCNNYKSYGYITDLIKRRCFECSKNTDMIDLSSKKCDICQIKYPIFGCSNDTKPNRCGDCREKDMIDIKCLKCQYPNCTKKYATHGYPGF